MIAESVGISQLKDEVADALAPDVEYRLRDIIFEAIKFQKHGRRDTLTTEDINYALRLRNSEPLYGFTSSDPPRFCRALTPGVFYLEDPELNLSHMLEEPLPRAPLARRRRAFPVALAIRRQHQQAALPRSKLGIARCCGRAYRHRLMGQHREDLERRRFCMHGDARRAQWLR